MDYKKYNDYELLYMVRENDDVSKNLLFEKYHPIVCSLASEFYYKYSNYGYDYDDFYQEALITLDKCILTYDDASNNTFYTYLVACIKKSLLSFARNISGKTKNISNNLLIDIDDIEMVDKANSISEIIKFQQLQEIIKDIIYDFKIPIEYTIMLELRINGFTYREIGSFLGIPSSTIEFKFRRIKKLVKDKLNVYYKK